MRKIIYMALIAVIGLALTSCEPAQKDFYLSDLQGLWLEDNTEHYVRFTTEQSDESPYLVGREWDEAEDVSEQDLIDQRNRDHFMGNGWFKYWLEQTGKLTEIHMMDNGGAEIPQVYILTTLTSTKLAYYEKDQKSNKFSFTKK
jgi:hypothetical protein